ncbi:methyltransferase domain-containing protein [Streptomyces sp. NPDC051597]|uniref:methyltransferase domain-containing protein n=1 Tax=Streptomyces sp. NPDC051597 TaxID=3155049 RepID=UPI0034154AA9
MTSAGQSGPSVRPDSGEQGLVAEVARKFEEPLPQRYDEALRRVSRHLFLPDVVWPRDGVGGWRPVTRESEPAAWWQAAYADAPLVTQFTDGQPSSSASMPSLVVRALMLADPAHHVGTAVYRAPGAGTGQGNFRFLELGTGTGYNAALLCALHGDSAVTTQELDPQLAQRARRALKSAGYTPTIVIGDASRELLHREGLFDVIEATFSVDHVPDTWRAAVRPGGRIVTPWFSDWSAFGTLAVDVYADGAAVGRFHPFGSFMTMRIPGTPSAGATTQHSDGPGQQGGADAVSTTSLSPWRVAGADPDADFHLGIAVPHVSYEWDTSGQHVPVRLWLAHVDQESVAAIDYDGRDASRFTVRQWGPKCLWDAAEAAYARWELLGRPGVGDHTLTITPEGEHVVHVHDGQTPFLPRLSR